MGSVRARAGLAAALALGSACSFDASGMPGSGGDGGALSPADAAEPGDAADRGDAAADAATAACADDRVALPFAPKNWPDVCAPEPDEGDGLRVPTGAEWVVRTDEQTIDVGPTEVDFSGIRFDVYEPPEAPELSVLVVRDLVIEEGAILWAEGSRPLALISLQDAEIGGGSRLLARVASGRDPAGSQPDACDGAGTGPPGQTVPDACEQTAGPRGSGGAGGGFGVAGGAGGDGGAEVEGPPGGDASEPGALPVVRGGCAGGAGGGNERGGDPGRAGGAIQLVAAGEILVHEGAAVSVSGGGGGAAREDCGGGGGGGAGGALTVEAPTVRVDGALTANGGGGGEGRRHTGVDDGQPGAEASATPAPGGQSSDSSGNGGAGGAREAEPEDGEDGGGSSRGGGGGGGAHGKILLRGCAIDVSEDDGAIVSPTPLKGDPADCNAL